MEDESITPIHIQFPMYPVSWMTGRINEMTLNGCE